jgi:glycosyltransferase involved in cell wall biosynthesis
MAVKDGAELIAETLASVMAQSLKPSQIVLVIDHAVDNTAEVATSVVNDIEIYYSEAYGTVPAMNLGIKKARSEYLAFLDHDDLWASAKQEAQINILIANPNIDVVCSATRNFSKKFVEGIEVEAHRDFSSTRSFSASTFRRNCFTRFGLIDESAGHFQWLYDWWSKASEQGISVEFLDDVHLLRRIHETNSWVTQPEEARRQVLETVRRHMNRTT